MISGTILLEGNIYVSYGQVMVYDMSKQAEAGLDWSDRHSLQGFARRASNVCFATLCDFGSVPLRVLIGEFINGMDYNRAIRVPFTSTTGEVMIAGPEEITTNRRVTIKPGYYRLTSAQKILRQGEEFDEEMKIAIDLYFEPAQALSDHSEILVPDEFLRPSRVLLEDAQVAEW